MNIDTRTLLQYSRVLPSLRSTNTLPPSPREIRISSSRYVVNNHDCARSAWIGNLSGGWPDMVLATETATFWRGSNNPRIGVRSIFCPITSTLLGTSRESVNFGVPITPSSNFIYSSHKHKTLLSIMTRKNLALNK